MIVLELVLFYTELEIKTGFYIMLSTKPFRTDQTCAKAQAYRGTRGHALLGNFEN